MKNLFILLFLFVAVQSKAQQQQEVYHLDSCKQFGKNAFDDVYIRVQQVAHWKNSKTSLDDHIDKFFKQYVQKTAGGKITISILINKEGKPCMYEARPNSNVRPDFQALKAWMEQFDWEPALQNGEPVMTIKILQISFSGRKVSVTELE